MYEYKIEEVTKVYDGDTITVIIDLGFGTFRKESLRLARINTPEVRGDEREDGLISRDWLREKINQAVVNNTPMYIKTYKDKTGKYGRYIADFYIGSLLYPCINDLLVQEGLAEYKEY